MNETIILNQGSKTFTTQGLKMLAELESIDDAVCDLYSGQDNRIVFLKMDKVGREAVRKYLVRDVIDPLHAWRAKYGMDYPL